MTVKLRIVPVITREGIGYQVQKKGWLFWGADKSSAGAECVTGYDGSFYIAKTHKYISHAVIDIKVAYGKSYSIEDYRP